MLGGNFKVMSVLFVKKQPTRRTSDFRIDALIYMLEYAEIKLVFFVPIKLQFSTMTLIPLTKKISEFSRFVNIEFFTVMIWVENSRSRLIT
jgi:hypothetical protein